MDKEWTLGWASRADNIGHLVGQSTYPFPILIYILVSCFPPPPYLLPSLLQSLNKRKRIGIFDLSDPNKKRKGSVFWQNACFKNAILT